MAYCALEMLEPGESGEQGKEMKGKGSSIEVLRCERINLVGSACRGWERSGELPGTSPFLWIDMDPLSLW